MLQVPCEHPHQADAVAVHNVGTNIRKPTVQYSDDDYSLVMSANLESTYKLSQVQLGPFLLSMHL